MTERKVIKEQQGFDFTNSTAAAKQKRQSVPARAHRPVERLAATPPTTASQPSPTTRSQNQNGTHNTSSPTQSGDVELQAITFSTRQQVPRQKFVPQVDEDLEEEDEDTYTTRPHSSAIRYNAKQDGQMIRRGNNGFYIHNKPRSSYLPPHQQEALDDPYIQHPRQKGGAFRRFLILSTIASVLMLAGYIGLNLVGAWWQTTMDDWHYGRPRTFQIDAVVGHNDSEGNPSHFFAINLNGRVTIIELPGGDSSKAKIYNGPYIVGDDDSLTPITLSFKDITGDGKPDMIVHDRDKVFYYINESGSFRPQKPGEHLSKS